MMMMKKLNQKKKLRRSFKMYQTPPDMSDPVVKARIDAEEVFVKAEEKKNKDMAEKGEFVIVADGTPIP